MATEIRDLLALPTADEVKAILLSFGTKAETPVTDWHVGAVFRTMLEIENEVIGDLVRTTLPMLAEFGYLDTATEQWLKDLARYWYAVDAGLPGVAQQTITLACATGEGPHVIAVGRVLLTTDGARYFALSGGTLSGGGTLGLDAMAESPGAARGLINHLESPLAGVTVQAAAIRIIATVPQYGADAESESSLRERCSERFPSLEEIDTEDRVHAWARAASDEVTRFCMDPDPVNPGGVLLTVAGPSGAISAGDVTDIQTEIDARQGITDLITAQNAANLAIEAFGTVTVKAEFMADAKLKANAAWIAYLASAQIGSLVYLSELVQAVMDAGALDFTGYSLNGPNGEDGDGNAILLTTEVPVPDDDLATALDWEAAS